VFRVQEVIPVSKSKPYSSVPVKGVDIAALAAAHRGQACVVGVDVAKRELMAVLRWPDGSFQRPWRVANPGDLGLLAGKLKELSAACPVTVAMESSGTYGDPLRQQLSDAGLAVARVSAKAVKDQAEAFDGVPSQHDGKDAAVIADLCARGKGRPWPVGGGGTDRDQAIRYWVRRLDGAQRVKQVWGGKVEALLARHWPGVTRLVGGSSATLAGVLATWGGPAGLAADPEAARKLRGLGGRFLSGEKVAALIESARAPGGVRMNAWEERELKELGESVVGQRREIAGCKRRLRALARGHGTIEAQTPAVGLVAACVLWVCVGDPHDYGSGGAYRKAMGLNLVEQSGGAFKGRLRLSKRGQRLARKWMYFGALRWMRDPAVKRWVAAKKARDGGRGMRAMTGVMRRLAVAAWNVAVRGEAFEPGRLFPGTAAKAEAMPAATTA
jgi:transposase